jgi:hypothetical protein
MCGEIRNRPPNFGPPARHVESILSEEIETMDRFANADLDEPAGDGKLEHFRTQRLECPLSVARLAYPSLFIDPRVKDSGFQFAKAPLGAVVDAVKSAMTHSVPVVVIFKPPSVKPEVTA